MRTLFISFLYILISLSFSPAQKVSQLNINNLYDLLQSEGSIEGMLKKIAVVDNLHMSLVFETQNRRQFSSPEVPRIILGKNNLVFTLAGNANVKGGHVVEAIEFNSKSKSFDFFEIEFSGKNFSIHKNPPKCVSCHRNKPIWDTYPFWPGFYGSSRSPLPRSQIEIDNLTSFLNNGLSERYQAINLPLDANAAYEILESNNALLGGNLSVNNFYSIVSELQASRNYRKYSKALAASLLNEISTDDLIQIINPKDKAKLLKKFQSINRGVRLRFNQYIHRRAQRYSEQSGISMQDILEPRKPFNNSIAALDIEEADRFSRFVFVTTLMGFSKKHKWSMAFHPLDLGFFDGRENLMGLSSQLFASMLSELNLTLWAKENFIFKFSSTYRVFPPGSQEGSLVPYGHTKPIDISFFEKLNKISGKPRQCLKVIPKASQKRN